MSASRVRIWKRGDGMTYSQVALGAGICPAASEGGTNDGRDGMVAFGTGQVTVGGFGDSLGDGANSAVVVFYRHGESGR